MPQKHCVVCGSKDHWWDERQCTPGSLRVVPCSCEALKRARCASLRSVSRAILREPGLAVGRALRALRLVRHWTKAIQAGRL
jgi:hypothetical protein